MVNLGRRSLLAGGAAATLARPALGQSMRARVLRIVPQADLANLDPVWTTAVVTTSHGYAVFDTLYALDAQLRAQPQMAEGHDVSNDQRTWTIRLRQGLKFHDGEPVRARDCVASLIRWSKRDSFGQMLAQQVDDWGAADDATIRIKLKKPFTPLLEALGKAGSTVPFMMPERLARTDATTQITDMVGSGPYRFLPDEWAAGSRAAYARNEAYLPRNEPASFMAGGKRAYFDRIEWLTIPDPSTATAALINGEVDWLELSLPDLNPMLSRNKDVTVAPVDAFGLVSFLRFNCLDTPFSNGKLRHALLGAIDQSDYMQAVAGDAIRWQRCASMFPCGMPFSRELGAEFLRSPRDLQKTRAAVAASGYAGERAVIMSPTDFPSIAPLGVITADAFGKAGINVELQSMDWGTLVQRRASKAPTASGGWSIFHSWTSAVAMSNPALNAYVRGLGATGFFGWFESASIEKYTNDWLAAQTDSERQALFDTIQQEAWAAPPFIPLGQYYPTTALRADLTGRIAASNPLPWSIRRA
jgi:peptide/nickel transport system substrate-binding protein